MVTIEYPEYRTVKQEPAEDLTTPAEYTGNAADTKTSMDTKMRNQIQDKGEENEMSVANPEPHTGSKLRRMMSGCQSVRAFLVVVCFYILSFFIVEVYFMAVITSIEKRFGFRSSSMGLILTGKEIAYVIVVTPASHFGDKWHRPRFLSLLALLGAFASALSVLPHFIYASPYEILLNSTHAASQAPNTDALHMCIQSGSVHDNATSSGSCDGDGGDQVMVHNSGAYAIFMTSSVLLGIAQAPMLCLTTTYMDDAVGPIKNSFYLAFMIMMRGLGPVVAFLAGGLFTSYHETMEDPGYDSTDPRWVGAWWIGYLTNPCLLLISAFLIALFPRAFPRDWETEEMALERKQERVEQKTIVNILIDMVKGIGRLLRNPVYVFLMASGCFSSFVIAGLFNFMPKYIEIQFNLSASMANTITGTVSALLGVIGTFLGGMIATYWKWRQRECALFTFIISVFSTGFLFSMMMVKCEQNQYEGSTNMAFNETCSMKCGCDDNSFFPVCGANDVTYKSPCVAGCQKYYSNSTYGDCACVGAAGDVTASAGSCDLGCEMWKVYIVILALGALVGTMPSVPATTICLRCVDEPDRSLALGFTGTVVSCISFMTGPIIFGHLIDSTCVKWEESCGNIGHCLLYDNDRLRLLLHGTTGVLKALAVACNVTIWILIRRQKKTTAFTAVPIKSAPSDGMGETECGL